MKRYNLIEIFTEEHGRFISCLYDFADYQNAIYVRNVFRRAFKNKKYEVEEFEV